MAREMALAGVSAEELQPSPQAQPPRTPREKLANFWYHYKWVVIACLCGAVLLAVLIGELVKKNPADYTLVLATEQGYFASELKPLQTMLEAYAEDLDGDGEVEVQIITCQMNGGGTREGQLASFQNLQLHLASGDALLFVFEPQYYTWFKETMSDKDYEFFTPLPTMAGVGEDGRHWVWTPPAPENDAMTGLPEKLYFGVRMATGTAKGRTEEHAACMALLESVMHRQEEAQAHSGHLELTGSPTN